VWESSLLLKAVVLRVTIAKVPLPLDAVVVRSWIPRDTVLCSYCEPEPSCFLPVSRSSAKCL